MDEIGIGRDVGRRPENQSIVRGRARVEGLVVGLAMHPNPLCS